MGSGSTSVVSEHTVTGSHVLRIECFSLTKGLGIGESIDSDPFVVGGHTWVIRFYPDGTSYIDTDWISVDVCLESLASTFSKVRARIKFRVLNKQGSPVQAFKKFGSGDTTHEFSVLGSSKLWGISKFIKRAPGLEKSSYLRGDCLRIKCEVTVVTFGVRTECTTKKRRVTVPASDLHQDLGRLLSSQRAGDVVFEVDGELFTAHRIVLAARSSVFDAEFFGPMKEKTDARILIEDMEANVFRALLHFIYTDSLPAAAVDGEVEGEVVMAQHLLVAADRYDLKRLKLMCEDKLCDHIGIDTVATTMALAEQHACHGLRASCFEFLSFPGNLKKIVATDGYRHLKASCPSFLDELVDKLAT
jgi:speckle-type POZ protein